MPSAPISFANQQATGQEALAGAPGVALNVMVDQAGAIRCRPGISAAPGVFSGVIDSTGISGLRSTIGGALYAIGNQASYRQIYKVGATAAMAISSGTGPSTLAGSGRPVFAETQLILAIAGGDAMQKIVLSTDQSSRILDDPPLATHVAASASRLLGNIADIVATNTFDKSVVRFSDVANGNSSFAGLERWAEGITGAGHFSAEADPDPVLAIAENTNEVFCFGTTSLQVFDPDGTVTAGIPVGWSPAVARELGCSAPYSVVKVNQQFAWLDDLRRIVMSDGRSDSIVSDPVHRTFDDMSLVSDCFGYRVLDGPLDALVWTFPTDGRTFAFQKGSGWSQWASWNGQTNNIGQLAVLSCHLAPLSHDNLVGTSDGRIGRYDLDATTDFGSPINCRVETGYVNRGTDERKFCRCVRVALRRGATGNGQIARLSYRDEPGPYGTPLTIELGELGDTEIVVELRSLGIYRRRQWKFEFSGTDALALVGVTEDFDILST